MKSRFVSFGFFLVVGICCIILISTIKTSSIGLKSKDMPQLNSINMEKMGDAPYRSQHSNYIKLQFVSEHEGWVSNGNFLWHTTNGGQSWEKIWQSTNAHSLPEFYFYNSQIGWQYTPSKLLKTEDGGQTWKSMEPPMNEGEIIDIHFLDEKRGWLAGAIYRHDQAGKSSSPHFQRSYSEKYLRLPAIFFTNDGGEIWQQQILSKDPESAAAYNIRSVADTIWLAGGAKLYHLVNEKWKEIDFQRSNCLRDHLSRTTDTQDDRWETVAPLDLYFSDNEHGWLTFAGGYIAKTTDGGNSWCHLSILDDTRSFIKIYFKDTQHGWGLDNHGELYESKDSGTTWIKVVSTIKFDDMYFLDNNNGWIIAKEGLFRIGQ